MEEDRKTAPELDESAVDHADIAAVAEQTDESESTEKDSKTVAPAEHKDDKKPKTANFMTRLHGWHAKAWRHKKISIPVAVVIVLAVLAAIPFTRYTLAGQVLKQSFEVSLTDTSTHLGVSAATISLDGKSAVTDSNGKAHLKVPVGNHQLSVTKQYYATVNEKVLVPISGKGQTSLQLHATGRQVPITVLNKISGKPIANAEVKAAYTEVKTNKAGQATMVLPAGKTTLSGTVSVSGYNSLPVTIQVTSQVVKGNSFEVTPTGKVYFLSNLSGKIDVVKTNLDGSDRQTVLPGTGFEDDNNTVLLASRDWKYLALYSIRSASGANPEINLIDTTNGDKITNIDKGNASFSLIGWDNDSFTYLVYRNNFPNWQSGGTSLKSYDAQSGKIAVLDSTSATGTSNYDAQYEVIYSSDVHIIGSKIVYNKRWSSYYNNTVDQDKQDTLNSINADGTGKKVLSSLDRSVAFFNGITQYEPDELEVQIGYNVTSPATYYEYDADGTYTKTSSSEQPASSNDVPYPTYLSSPSGKQTFWSVIRDGKNTLFVGDASADHQQQVASLSDYTAFGWYSDNYLLVSKGGSELYIMPVSGGTALKITDYHKPIQSFYGYGGGYGGL